MKSRVLYFLLHIFVIGLLTIITQVGGAIWLLSYLLLTKLYPKMKKRWRLAGFLGSYLFCCFLIIPLMAKFAGRTALPFQGNIVPQTYFTILANRHYVRPALKSSLLAAAEQFRKPYPSLKVVYLDANFPFFDGFPLLPHLSHNDGRKLDLSFIYTRAGKRTNDKPSKSGYGVFAGPITGEHDQVQQCASGGYWQYSFSRFLTFGHDKSLVMDKLATKQLIETLLAQPQTQKIFLEPHLKQRLGLKTAKVRYHGCHAVRHDDHLHWQIK